MDFEYKTNGTCSTLINFKIEDNKIYDVSFTNGCNGNLKGIASLVNGMPVDEVIKKCEGITCRSKNTSCPDQLAKAIKNALKTN